MRDVTRKESNNLTLSRYFRVGLVAQWYGALIVNQKDGGSSLARGRCDCLFYFIFFLSVFFVLFCFVLFVF